MNPEVGTITEKDAAWRRKAHEIIGKLSRASYEQANRKPNGKLRKRHVPYSIPDTAEALVECLNKNDERRAKGIFMTIMDREEMNARIDDIV